MFSPASSICVKQKLFENPEFKDHVSTATIKKCFDERQRTIENQIIWKLMAVSLKSIKNVQDISRLLKKTNRGVQAKHLPYVDQIVQPLIDFLKKRIKKHSTNYQPDAVRRVLKDAFNQLKIQ